MFSKFKENFATAKNAASKPLKSLKMAKGASQSTSTSAHPARSSERDEVMAADRKIFMLADAHPPCQVMLPDNLTEKQLLTFPAFKNWIEALQCALALQDSYDHTFHACPYKLRGIVVESATWFTPNKLGFVKLQANVRNDREEWLPGSVFLRGGSVGILLILQSDTAPMDSEEQKFAVLTVQPRIAAGSLALAEIPAGMLDESGDFAGKAAAEIEEETSIKVNKEDLFNMSEAVVPSASIGLWRRNSSSFKASEHKEMLQNAMYPSPGGCDEFMPLFLCQKRLPQEDLDGLRYKLTGLRNEGENITLKLVPLEELWIEGGRDAKALAALTLYEGLRKMGKLHPIPEPTVGT